MGNWNEKLGGALMSGGKAFQAEAITSIKALRWEEGPSLSVKQQGVGWQCDSYR